MDKTVKTNPIQKRQLKHYMLYYNLVPDILLKRVPYKDEHMKILQELSSRGLVFVGSEVVDGFPAVFMFEGENDDILQEWLKRDPYLQNGLVIEHHFNQIILVEGNFVEALARASI
jgi:uncharacterized protein